MSEQSTDFIIPEYPEAMGYLGVQEKLLHPDELSANMQSPQAGRALVEATELFLQKQTNEIDAVLPHAPIATRSKNIDYFRKSYDDTNWSLDSGDSSAHVFKKVLRFPLKLFTGKDVFDDGTRQTTGLTERQLIDQESQVGSQLFGAIPAGDRREFFCLDATTWIWHEEWTDVETGKPKTMTTRYEVHDNGILKAQEATRYSFIEGDELNHLLLATQMYYEQVARSIYKRDPQTGQKLV